MTGNVGVGDVGLVDHALSRLARRGALAVVTAEGPENTEVFEPVE